jgi:hypothetical protein
MMNTCSSEIPRHKFAGVAVARKVALLKSDVGCALRNIIVTETLAYLYIVSDTIIVDGG